MFFKNLTASGEQIIPSGLNGGYIINDATSSTNITITPPDDKYEGYSNDSYTILPSETFIIPNGADITGLKVVAGASTTGKIVLFRVGGKPESDEGRKK